jgi:hypothetical protein
VWGLQELSKHSCGQLQAPSYTLEEKPSCIKWIGELVGPNVKNRKICALPEIEPRFPGHPARTVVIILAETEVPVSEQTHCVSIIKANPLTLVYGNDHCLLWDSNEIHKCVGFEVFTAVVMKSIIFWDVTPCSLLKCNWRCGGTYRLHLQGRRKFQQEPASNQVASPMV